MDKVLFSHNSDNWNTPKALLENLKNEYGELFDPCPANPTFDGLAIQWKEKNFVNPPYSNWAAWIKKAYDEYILNHHMSVLLLPARTDTKAFHHYAMRADEIRFIKGRLKFSESKNSAPFPSMLVIYNPKNTYLPVKITAYEINRSEKTWFK